MSKAMEDRISEKEMQNKILIIANLLSEGVLSNEEIAEAAKVPLETIEEIVAEFNSENE
ncbi:MAG: hypothetical protein MJ071_07795 [Oscillospiraceae bacterium]|nr:hypothetical protein [Oscillospiraceae bacterium]